MIAVMGDTHGYYDYFKFRQMADKHMKGEIHIDFAIIAGDFGFIWKSGPGHGLDEDDFANMVAYFGKYDFITFFVPGNHENYNVLDRLPRKIVNGALCAEIIPNKLYMIDRGEIITLNNKTFLCIGGALSIDKAWRKENISWWPQELINEQDIKIAKENLKKRGNKVDYVITHTAPEDIATLTLMRSFEREPVYYDKKKDPSCAYLSEIKDITIYKKWYFGHFHVDADDLPDSFVAMYDNVHYID